MANDSDRRHSDQAGVGPDPGSSRDHGLVPLEDLSGYSIADGDPDIRGWSVRTQSGRDIGEIERLLVDQDRGEVVMVEVEMRDGGAHAEVPIRAIELDREQRIAIVENADFGSRGASSSTKASSRVAFRSDERGDVRASSSDAFRTSSSRESRSEPFRSESSRPDSTVSASSEKLRSGTSKMGASVKGVTSTAAGTVVGAAGVTAARLSKDGSSERAERRPERQPERQPEREEFSQRRSASGDETRRASGSGESAEESAGDRSNERMNERSDERLRESSTTDEIMRSASRTDEAMPGSSRADESMRAASRTDESMRELRSDDITQRRSTNEGQ